MNDVRHLKQLERENARLKKLFAERDLEIEVTKEVNRASPDLIRPLMSFSQGSSGLSCPIFTRFSRGSGGIELANQRTYWAVEDALEERVAAGSSLR